jgi:FkbM family methyltransferase
MIKHPKLLARAYLVLLRLSKGRGAQTLARLDAALLPMRRSVELDLGVAIELAPDPHFFGYLLKTHETHIRDWILECAPNAKVFFDVGANIGYFTGWAISRMSTGSTVCLLEPDPENFQATAWTESVAAARGIQLRRFHGAASDRSGDIFLNRHPRFSTYHSVSACALPGDTCSVKVSAVTLTDLTASCGLQNIDCLKIDVEGHEGPVLRGATELFQQRRIGSAVVEITPGMGTEVAFELGHQTGYSLHLWSAGRWHPWEHPAQITKRVDVRLDAVNKRL